MRAHEVQHIGAVEPLALHDEALRTDQFFRRAQQDIVAEHRGRDAVPEGLGIHGRQPRAAVEDDIDLAGRRERLAQPVRELLLGVDPLSAEDAREPRPRVLLHHEVEILGAPIDAGVAAERVGAAHEEWNARADQGREHLPVKLDRIGLHRRSGRKGYATARPRETCLRTRVGGMGLARFYQVSMTSPSQIPAPPAPRDAAHVSITAMADLHFGRFSTEMYAPVLTAAASTTDVLVLCGDLTDHGRP